MIISFCVLLSSVSAESHIDFRTQSVIMALKVGGGVWGVITNSALKFRKIIEFQGPLIFMDCQ